MRLVGATLLLFLGFRVALVTGIGIPFAFLGALLLMSLFGITINLITMFGLIIVLGMIVDDAIIVGENIFRHMEEGMEVHQAAVQGTTEVMGPVVSTVLTTVAAFIPLVLAPDVFGQVLRWVPVVVTITLAASLFEVLLIMPCHVVDLCRWGAGRGSGRNQGKAAGHAWMSGLRRAYAGSIRGALRWRYLFLPLVMVLFAGLLVVARDRMKIDIFPANLIDIFFVRVTAAQGTPLEQTDALAAEVEARIQALPETELEDVVSYIGAEVSMQGGFSGRGTHYATMLVYLTPQNTRARRTLTIVDELREQTRGIPGIERLEFEMVEPGPPTGKPLEVKVRGKEYATLQEISGKLMDYLETRDGVEDIQQDYEPGKEELHIRIDESEAARLGLDVEAIARTGYAAFQGAEATEVREGNEEIKVRVWLREPFRDDEASLQDLYISHRTGRLIPLSRVARFEPSRGLPNIHHYDGDRVITVTASLAEGVNAVEENRSLEAAFRDLPQRYPGYDLIRGGEWKDTLELQQFMVRAFLMAMLMIYGILTVQFNSFFQPLVVMAAIPLGIIGVIIALIAHQQPISIMASLGMIGLAGVVVNDAIVLVKFINDHRRREDRPVFEAIVLAGEKRLRPILLTSVTTIAGLLPVIYGWGGYEPFVAPAAISLAYGLLFATFLTLVVVPCVYHVAYDLKRGAVAAVRLAGSPFRRGRRAEPDPASIPEPSEPG
jgi:multidrug efflux pump subunit AcrB